MSSLDNTSSDAAVLAAYDDAASYYEDNDPVKARALVTAGTILLRRRPSSVTQDGNTIELDLSLIATEVKTARQFANTRKTAAAGGTGVLYVRTDTFRD